MPTYRLDLAFDGAGYCGWQRQPNQRSIQETVEQCLQQLFPQEQIVLQGAGRTDAGVHALQQVAAFTVSKPREPKQILRGLNAKLPSDIVCSLVQQMDDDFHPRSHSKTKMYRYRILHRSLPCPFRRGVTWHISKALDIASMQQAARLFVGDHDFRGYRASKCSSKTTIRTITKSQVYLYDDEVRFEVEGKGFLRHMVRIMTGVLVAVGEGQLTVDFVDQSLSGVSRSALAQTAPSHGLCLVWTSLLDNAYQTE